MRNYRDHLVGSGTSVKEALSRLDQLALDAILFVIDDEGRLIGSLTDGDVRRGLLKDKSIQQPVDDFIQPNPRYIRKGNYTIDKIRKFRELNLNILPVINGGDQIVNVLNLRVHRSYLPVDAVIMAGGKGSRLRPMTETTPKPLLKIGDKPIIDHHMDRLGKYGVDDFWISINYLGDQLVEHFQDGSHLGVSIQYIRENMPLGTIGAVSYISDFQHDHILIANSDILTNIDYEDFYMDFLEKGADMSVVTIPYEVNVPYAVMETSNHHVLSFKEKPTYTYYSNGGIYLVKKAILDWIPKETFYNSTDLMEKVIKEGRKLISYPMRQYWLDIGKPEDFERAQEDIKHLEL